MKNPFRNIRHSITMRWLISVLSVVVIAVILVAVAVGILVRTYLFNSLRSALPDYAAVFDQLSAAPAEFREAAIAMTESFDKVDKIKVSVLDKDGNVFTSTDGFPSYETAEDMPDFQKALTAEDGTASYSGRREADGQSIYSTTVLLRDTEGTLLGAYRYQISLRPFERTVGTYYLVIALVGLVMIALVSISGRFFISSIVRPVRQVTGAARKIAMGDLTTHLESKNEDEIGELCDAINYMASELGKADTMKNDFISSVSHELRTPLTAIRGWGETVQMSIGEDDETVRRGVDVMLTEADRLSKLVEELLDFSRMQSGKLNVNMSGIDIEPILTEAVNMYFELARKQNVLITYFRPKQPLYVMADRDRLKQVFINIVDNAVKYTNEGGEVIVTTVLEEGCVWVIVNDTGVGIAKEDIDHVKEKFYKANKTVRGSGIGLAVADEIMKQHNGLLFLESTENVGTTVTVVLPVLDAPSTDPEGKEPTHE